MKTAIFRRIVTALGLGTAAVFAIIFLHSGLLSIIVGLITVAAGWEWCRLRRSHRSTKLGDGAFLLFLAISAPIFYRYPAILPWLAVVAMLWWLRCTIYVVFKSNVLSDTAWSVNYYKGILTLLPAGVVLTIAHDSFEGGRWYVLVCLLIVWASDISAYIVGNRYGKRLLSPTISPGKTVEGFLGGIVAGVVIGVMSYQVGKAFFDMSFYKWFVLVTTTSLFAAVGDLSESAFKRRAGVKDSGTLLPGHGGVLDRIDSSLASIPMFVACLVFF